MYADFDLGFEQAAGTDHFVIRQTFAGLEADERSGNHQRPKPYAGRQLPKAQSYLHALGNLLVPCAEILNVAIELVRAGVSVRLVDAAEEEIARDPQGGRQAAKVLEGWLSRSLLEVRDGGGRETGAPSKLGLIQVADAARLREPLREYI